MANYTASSGPCGNGPCPQYMQAQVPQSYPQVQAAPQSGIPGYSQYPSSVAPVAPPYLPSVQDEFAPITPLTQPMPVTVESLQYINGYLRTQIGKKVTVDFLIGTNTLVDKTGTLLAVGANYIIINEIETDDLLVCDFFNIKFVRIYL